MGVSISARGLARLFAELWVSGPVKADCRCLAGRLPILDVD
jgi:hypothetical protein